MLRDFFEDSWTFQETLEEGREEGRKQGLEEGREQGLKEGFMQGHRRSIEMVTQARFPGLVSVLTSKIASLSNQEQLQKILNAVIAASTEDELRQFLATLP